MSSINQTPDEPNERDVNPTLFAGDDDPQGIQTEPASHQKRSIVARETISTSSFMAEHHQWLNQLLQARHNRDELLQLVFRYITKETIRLLPSEHHQALYNIFLEMGDSVRVNWCLEPRADIVTVLRDIPIPPRSDFKRYMDNAVRLWYIGDKMIREGNIGGTELMRMSTDFIICLNFFSQKEAFLKDQMKIVRAAAARISQTTEQRASSAPDDLASVRATGQAAGTNPDPAAHLREARDRLIRGLDDTQSDGQL